VAWIRDANRGEHVADPIPSVSTTERCTFKLTKDGLELIEIAPGVDLERDVLAHMEFRPLIKQSPRLMDSRIFRPELMDLKDELLRLPLDERLVYDRRSNVFFVNFEGLEITRPEEIAAINDMIEARLGRLSEKVRAVVNYDNCIVSLELVDRYLNALKRVRERYFADVTRYTTSAFLRMKLGSALQQHDAVPHTDESESKALGKWRERK
jgi:propionate CoA-transferase